MNMPAHWQQYVTVDDCDAAVERAKKNGGQLVAPAVDAAGVGRFATIQDPLGAYVGVIKPEARA